MRTGRILAVVTIVVAAVASYVVGSHIDTSLPMPTMPSSPTKNEASAHAVEASHELDARRQADSDSDASPFARDCIVQVVDEHGAPVAGCVVHHDDGDADEQVQSLAQAERRQYWNDQELRLRTFGGTSHTDDDGRVALRTHLSHFAVCARDGVRFAADEIDRRHPPPVGGRRLVLRTDTALRVQCLDHLGAPAAGVPLSITRHAPDGQRLEEIDLPVGFVSDDHGNATLRHAQNVLPRARDGDTLRVTADVLGAEGPWATFAPHALPTQPLLLVLPPLGHLTLRLLVDDRPPPGRHLLELYHGTRRILWPDADTGITTCRWVALRTAFEVRLVDSDWPQSDRPWRIDGPGEPLQTRHVDLPVPANQTFAVARFLDRDGRPLGNRRLHMTSPPRTQGEPKSSVDSAGWPIVVWKGGVTTDEGGRACWPVLLHGRSAVRQMVQAHASADEGPALRAVVTIPLSTGVHDLGDVPLVARSAAVRGRFDTGEHPAPYFQWHVERQLGDTRWVPVDALNLQHDHTGRFTAYGELAPGRCRIAPSQNTALSFPPVEFEAGDQDVVVPIPNEWLAVAVLLPDDMPWGVIGELVPLQTAMPLPAITFFTFDVRVAAVEPAPGELHSLRWSRLPRGSYRLELRLFGLQEPLHVVPELALPHSEAPLVFDLRGRIGVTTVLLDEPVPEATVLFVPTRVPARPLHHPFVGGAVRFPVPNAGAEVLVIAPGRRAVRLLATPGRHVVRLLEATQVRIEIPALARLPEGVRASLQLLPLQFDGPPQSRNQGGGNLGGLLQRDLQHELRQGTTTVEAVVDGTVTITLSNSTTAVTLPPRQVTMPDGEAPLRIEVPASDLQVALQQLVVPTTGR